MFDKRTREGKMKHAHNKQQSLNSLPASTSRTFETNYTCSKIQQKLGKSSRNRTGCKSFQVESAIHYATTADESVKAELSVAARAGACAKPRAEDRQTLITYCRKLRKHGQKLFTVP